MRGRLLFAVWQRGRAGLRRGKRLGGNLGGGACVGAQACCRPPGASCSAPAAPTATAQPHTSTSPLPRLASLTPFTPLAPLTPPAGLMEGTARPDYRRCVEISTAASISEMIPPGFLVMGTPLIVGTLFGVRTLAGAGAGRRPAAHGARRMAAAAAGP